MNGLLRSPGRMPRGWAGAAVALALLAGLLLFLLPLQGEREREPEPDSPPRQAGLGVSPSPPLAGAPGQLATWADAGRAATGAARPAGAACPFQQLQITLAGGSPQAACVDATRVQQNGGVRSYLAAGSGVASWALRVEVAGGAVIKAALRAGDGRSFACEAEACAGLALSSHDARGLRSITLDGLALGAARVSGRLAVPADDLLPGLACTGPSVSMNSPDGSARRFCGQGGAGVEIADDGLRRYRFEDAEGRSLAVSVNGERQVTRIEYGTLACSGSGCAGASMVALAPESELSERSFFFGRTVLHAGSTMHGPAGSPQLVLDGSLTLPAQE